MTRRTYLLFALVALGACVNQGSGCSAGASCGASPKINVFAAASLQPPFDKIAGKLHFDASFNYAGTQTLAAQLINGAQADIFASADIAHMNTVEDAGLVATSPPRIFAHNRLEIAVARGNPKGIHSLADLGRSGLIVVLADPSVPAGKYAQQALKKAAVHLKPASLELEVTAVLNKVALGEADAGIVYVSDVVTSGRVDGVAIPDPQNVIADYPIAVLVGAQNKSSADTFVNFVLSADGQSILAAAGFQKV